MALYELRAYMMHLSKMAQAVTLSGNRLPGTPEGRVTYPPIGKQRPLRDAALGAG
jgi:hypothetical protein